MARTPASGISTRDRLLRVAEELFATSGVHGAQLREIVTRAGQANPSAVQYHFGSREGLLEALMAERQQRVEAALAALGVRVEQASLPELLDALITAESSELRTERGRHCLRISAQLSHDSGVRSRQPHPGLAGTGYWRLISALERPLTDPPHALPEPVRLERIDLVLSLIGTALAERARQLTAGEPTLTTNAAFLADLAAISTAMLTAPTPSS
ncbi:TetR/AcrR family transcriptional regulator [Streptacidiphilus anmyonensis]|uniref:TetR/AcrR family transcriptional regulator n=1 Tax=Streptacidiphilus anmyonensis TaxID=405782 RepID=UPI0005A9348C|nr:TetR family transcriptional regulator [Streptacidiphilus anmyonensis]